MDQCSHVGKNSWTGCHTNEIRERIDGFCRGTPFFFPFLSSASSSSSSEPLTKTETGKAASIHNPFYSQIWRYPFFDFDFPLNNPLFYQVRQVNLMHIMLPIQTSIGLLLLIASWTGWDLKGWTTVFFRLFDDFSTRKQQTTVYDTNWTLRRYGFVVPPCYANQLGYLNQNSPFFVKNQRNLVFFI